MTARYNHAFTIAFSLVTTQPDGCDATPAALRAALLKRLAALSDEELLEAVGAPSDSYELDAPSGEAA